MFTDPQSITIDAVANSMPKINSQATKSIYKTADGTLQLTLSHQATKGRTRRMARVDKVVVAADPLSAVNSYQTAAVYVVFDTPDVGFTADNIDDIVQGFKTWLSTANVTKILGGEH